MLEIINNYINHTADYFVYICIVLIKINSIMEKINLELSRAELDIVFNCLIGNQSCPPEHEDFVNRVFELWHSNRCSFDGWRPYCEPGKSIKV